jgi:hypothetical protein
MPRFTLVLNALVALGVAAVVLLGGHKPDSVAFELTDANGALTLANSHAGAAIFNGQGLRPGVPVNGSVTIGNTGAGRAELALAATAESASGGDLWNALQLRVTDATDPVAPVVLYDGPLAQLGRRDLGALAAGATRTYLLTAELPADAGDALQGARLSFGFAWTAQGASPATATTPTPTATPVPPAPTATPVAPTADPNATVTADALVELPAATACVKRTTLTLRLKRPKGVSVAAVTVKVAKRKAVRVKGTKVVLRRLPARGRYTVTVTTRLASGRALKTARTYRACTTSR